jgi:hypothetical protein
VRQSDEQLDLLASGEADYKFALKTPKVAKPPAVKVPPPSGHEVRQAMLDATDEASAHGYFIALKLKPAELKQIALELDLPATGTAKAITDGIIKVLVTGRRTTSAVRF